MFINKYSFNLADPAMEYLWNEFCNRKIAEGMHLITLPHGSPRPIRAEYDLIPMGHYRIDKESGNIFYDWVLYDSPAKVIMEGYTVLLRESDGPDIYYDRPPTVRKIAPLPPPPPGWVPEVLSRTAQAVQLLENGTATSQAEAAAMVGIAAPGVSAAIKRAGVRYERPRSVIALAADWVQAAPSNTQAEAARMFGVAASNISAELKRRRGGDK